MGKTLCYRNAPCTLLGYQTPIQVVCPSFLPYGTPSLLCVFGNLGTYNRSMDRVRVSRTLPRYQSTRTHYVICYTSVQWQGRDQCLPAGIFFYSYQFFYPIKSAVVIVDNSICGKCLVIIPKHDDVIANPKNIIVGNDVYHREIPTQNIRR